MEFHIAVCDDEPIDREELMRLTGQVLKGESIDFCMESFDCADSLLTAIADGRQFQLLLLDVVMNEMNGIELAAALRRLDNHTFIVFVSSCREMALYGYEVDAVRYLAKPVEFSRLREALLYCYRFITEKKEILLPTEHGEYRISLDNIISIEAFGKTVQLTSTGGTVTIAMRISEIQKLLPSRTFFLVHRSYLVNLEKVKSISQNLLLTSDGHSVPISKYRYAKTREAFAKFLQS